MNLFYATLFMPTLSLTSQNSLCLKPWYLKSGSDGASLIKDLPSSRPPSHGLHLCFTVWPQQPAGALRVAQPSVYRQDTRAFSPLTLTYKRNQERMLMDSGKSQRGLSGRDMHTHKTNLLFGYGRWFNIKKREIRLSGRRKRKYNL